MADSQKTPVVAPLTFYTYISNEVPEKVDEILKKAGYPKKPINLRVRSEMLKDYVKQDKDNALIEIGRIHPDKELIEKIIQPKNADGSDEECGCGKCAACLSKKKMSADGYVIPSNSADGTPEFKKTLNISENTMNILIVMGGLVVISTVVGLIVTSKK